MTERPILFSGPMVRALLAGRKTQTRRIIKPQPARWVDGVYRPFMAEPNNWQGYGRDSLIHWYGCCPYGVPGDSLWVREGHLIYDTHGQRRQDGQRWGPWGGLPTRFNEDRTKIAYFREGFDRCDPGRWRPSIHMPRWASRLTLDITDVRVQRLHDISEADAEAEGVREPSLPPIHMVSPEACGEIDRQKAPAHLLWQLLWSGINGQDSWAANPWVWAVTFEVRQ